MASIKGKLFEYFVYRLLISCGFRKVVPDGLLVYNGAPGLMVQGLGQPHNADVLLSPPIQTPFYYPTRLLVECKCYNDRIGLPIIRNALGLREDINNFDVVTDKILENRKSPRSHKQQSYSMTRYTYQVAVASIDGFKSTAIPFAQAHRIPLISFASSSLFLNIRSCIDVLEAIAQEDHEYADSICAYIKEEMSYHFHNPFYYRNEIDPKMKAFFSEISILEDKVTIGLLNDGTILFLISQANSNLIYQNYEIFDDGFSIHWSSEQDNTWVLNDKKRQYYFELPNEIYNAWLSTEGEKCENALRVKQDYFSQIVLFNKRYNAQIQTINLSQEFMRTAERNIEETDQ